MQTKLYKILKFGVNRPNNKQDTAGWPYISLLNLTYLNRCISVKTSLINARLGVLELTKRHEGSGNEIDKICLSIPEFPDLVSYVLLVLFLAPRGFSPGIPVFPSPQKLTFPNSNSIWIIVKHFIMSLYLFSCST